MPEKIVGQCTIAKVQTMADGGKRVYLDFPEDSALLMAQLMECQRLGVYLDVTFEAHEAESDGQPTESRKIHI